MRKSDFAYVLHRLSYRESSFLLRCFTQQSGMISVIAKGAKSKVSSKKALLQPFQALSIQYAGKGSLFYLNEVEMAVAFSTYAAEVFMSGFYINELLMKLLPENEAFPELFLAYQQLLNDHFCESSLRKFEKILLAELGFAIDFERDAEGRKIEAGAVYGFLPGRGFYLATNERPGDILYPGSEIHYMAADAFDLCRLLAKKLMQSAFAYHLGEKTLNTRRMFLALER